MNPIPPGDAPPEPPAPHLISVRCDTCRSDGIEAWNWYRDFPEECPGTCDRTHAFERYAEMRCKGCRWRGWIPYRTRDCPRAREAPGLHRLEYLRG